MLLTEAGAGDADVCAEVLLAALSAEQVRHWLEVEHRSVDDLRAAVVMLSVRLAATG